LCESFLGHFGSFSSAILSHLRLSSSDVCKPVQKPNCMAFLALPSS
jgi:hypothetical protein